MPVSSLIFVVIVATWAAYLVQHWMRRREDAAAHRSVDEFSDTMRVLDKRPGPGAEPPASRRRGHAVRRRARAVDVATQAVPAVRGSSPLVARRSEARLAEEQHESLESYESFESFESVDRLEHVAPLDDVSGLDVPADASAPPARVPVFQRRLRALVLLASLLWVPASVVLAATGILLWVSVPLALATVVAVLFWLRTEARADRQRAARFRAAAARRVRRVRDVRRTRSRVAVAPVLSAEDTQVIHSASTGRVTAAEAAGAAGPVTVVAADPQGPPAVASGFASETFAAAVPDAPVVASDAVFDLEAVAAEAVVVAEPAQSGEQDQQDAPGSWSPVPVPKPTYALKAKAEPRYTEGGIPADVFDTPEFADEAAELDDRALFARRAASQ